MHRALPIVVLEAAAEATATGHARLPKINLGDAHTLKFLTGSNFKFGMSVCQIPQSISSPPFPTHSHLIPSLPLYSLIYQAGSSPSKPLTSRGVGPGAPKRQHQKRGFLPHYLLLISTFTFQFLDAYCQLYSTDVPVGYV